VFVVAFMPQGTAYGAIPLGKSAHVVTRPGTESVVMALPDQPDVFVVAFMPQGTAYGAIPLTIPGLVLAAVNSILKLVPHKGEVEKRAKDAAKDVEASGYACGTGSAYGCSGRRCSCGR
jgi:hypothetical protein